MPKPDLFLELKDVTFSQYQAPLFHQINWQVNQGETWLITGPMGSGKSTFAQALKGKYPLRHGQILYHFQNQPGMPAYQASRQIALISFSPQSGQLNYGRYYYQQRFHSSEADGLMRLGDLLREAAPAGSCAGEIAAIAARLGLGDLLDLEVIKLSNGQTRKMLLARALLQHPRMLILDNPYAGLDTQSREDLGLLIAQLIGEGIQVLLITNQNEIPSSVTHVLEIRDFQVQGQFTIGEYRDKQQIENRQPPAARNLQELFPAKPQKPNFSIALKMENTTVCYGRQAVLEDINWTVRAGEKWALTGPNGSGKTTLLSLINGDNPQAFANKITLFDRRKGSGESIWDIKKRIGFVSPELHLYFRQDMKAQTVAATGLLDTLYLNRSLSEAEENKLQHFFAFFGLEHIRQKGFLHLSSGEQRLVLLIRSLVKNPDLLIWDEPFQGLNNYQTGQCLELLQAYATPEKTLILVSHHAEEIPDWVNSRLEMEKGKIKNLVF